MKRTAQMKTGGIPVAGMRAKNFKGWRKSSKHWRETRTLVGFSKDGLPIHKYVPDPLYVVHPVRRAKNIKNLREWLVATNSTAGDPDGFKKQAEFKSEPWSIDYL